MFPRAKPRDRKSAPCLRGASQLLASVRMASKSKNKPPTTSSDGNESRRWREGTAAPRDAEIVLREDVEAFHVRRVNCSRDRGQASIISPLYRGPLLQEEGHEFVVAAVARDL